MPDVVDYRPIKNAISGVWSYAVPIAVSLFAAPYILHKLGTATYGIWMLSNTMVAYLLIYKHGIVEGIVKCMSDSISRVGPTGTAKVVGTTLTILCAVSLAEVVLALAVADYAPRWFGLHGDDARLFHHAIVLTAISIVPTLISLPYSSVLAGLQRFDLTNLFAVLAATFGPIAGCIVLRFGGGLLGIIEAGIVLAVAILAIQVHFAKKLHPGLASRPRWEPSVSHEVGRFTFYSMLTSSATNAAWLSDDSLIGILIGASAVTYYSIPLGIAARVWSIGANVAQMLTPMTIEAMARGPRDDAKAMLVLWNRTLGIAFLSVVVAILYAGPSFLAIWLGEEFAAAAGVAFRVQAIAISAIVLCLPSIYVINGIGMPETNTWSHGMGAVVMLGLMVWLVPRHGIEGAALALCGFPLGLTFSSYVMLKELFSDGKATAALRMWAIPIAGFACMTAVLWFSWWDARSSTFAGVAIYASGSAAGFLLLCAAFEVIANDLLVTALCVDVVKAVGRRVQAIATGYAQAGG